MAEIELKLGALIPVEQNPILYVQAYARTGPDRPFTAYVSNIITRAKHFVVRDEEGYPIILHPNVTEIERAAFRKQLQELDNSDTEKNFLGDTSIKDKVLRTLHEAEEQEKKKRVNFAINASIEQLAETRKALPYAHQGNRVRNI